MMTETIGIYIVRKMIEMCADIVSAVVFRLFFVFFTIHIVVVAATLGAIAGAVIGWSNKMWLVQNVIIGAVSWTILSYNLSKVTFDYLVSDGDDELGLAVKLVKVIARHPRFMRHFMPRSFFKRDPSPDDPGNIVTADHAPS